MNNEISNVIRLSPVHAVKSDNSAALGDEVAKLVSGNSAPLENAKPTSQADNAENTAKPDTNAVRAAAEEGNQLLQSVKRNLEFKVDDSTQELVVKIVDSNSGEVVKQIPSEEMLAFVKRMQELEGQQGSVLRVHV